MGESADPVLRRGTVRAGDVRRRAHSRRVNDAVLGIIKFVRHGLIDGRRD